MKLSDEGRKQLAMAALVGAAGIELAILVGVGAWAGQRLDVRLTSSPWGMASGILIGAAAGFWFLVRTLRLAKSARAGGSSR